MRILLTGASGFIGGHTAHALVAAGHNLRILARPTSNLQRLNGLPYETAIADLAKTMNGHERLAAACEAMDAIVHVAGVTVTANDAEFEQANAQGSGALAAAAAQAGVKRFLYLSSAAAIGPAIHGMAPPADAPCQPVSVYGHSKAAGERAALAFADSMAVQVLRPPVVYGPGDRGLLPFFKMARYRYIVRLGRGHNRVSMIYGPDLVDAMVRLLASAPAPSPYFHISDANGSYSWGELIEQLADAFGHRLLTVPLPGAGLAIAAQASAWMGRRFSAQPLVDRSRVVEMRQPAWLTDNDALTTHTGWMPQTALTAGLQETVRWYRSHHWI